MPPYGLYSLANTPEELLNRAYGTDYFYNQDPAFGQLVTEEKYVPAPFTGERPFQNLYGLNARGYGYYGDVTNPSFGGSSSIDYNQYNPFKPFESTGIMQQVPLDMNRFQGVSDMSLIDETTNDEQDQEYIDQVDQSNNKFGGLMDLIGNIAIPGYGFFKNMAKGGLEGLRGFGRKLGQSDFAQSKNHMEYLGKRQARKERERLAPIEKQLRETSERSGGYQPTTKSQNVARTDSRVSNGKTRAYGL